MERAAKREQYDQWKALIPVLYDSFTSHCLIWPSLSCRWGPIVETHTYKNKQRVYLSEQTDKSVPNTLVVAMADVIKPHVAAGEPMSNFTYEGRSPLVKKQKTIIHPGEVNRIRECPQHPSIVATHTDSPEVLIWNIETQPNRAQDTKSTRPDISKPDLVLIGQTEDAPYALNFSPAAPSVISGGKDHNVVLWSIDDQLTSLIAKGSTVSLGAQTVLRPRGVYKGHESDIEDVCFRPSSAEEFASVGDDQALLFWDTRTGNQPVAKVLQAHKDDVHSVDWNALDEDLILTGSADASVRLFDRRKLGDSGDCAVHVFKGHDDAITCVQWNPHRATVFGSSGEDACVRIWDTTKLGSSTVTGKKKAGPPPELLFQHIGHQQKVVEFQWNPYDPWTVLSVSDENTDEGIGGSIVQIWRMNDLIYLPEEEALGELSKHREAMAGRGPKPVEDKAVQSPAGAKRKKEEADKRGKGKLAKAKDEHKAGEEGQKPEEEEQKPGEEAQEPGEEAKPEEEAQKPYEEPQKPDEESQKPNGENGNDDEECRKLDEGSQNLDQETSQRDQEMQKPEEESEKPEEDSKKPEEESEKPEEEGRPQEDVETQLQDEEMQEAEKPADLRETEPLAMETAEPAPAQTEVGAQGTVIGKEQKGPEVESASVEKEVRKPIVDDDDEDENPPAAESKDLRSFLQGMDIDQGKGEAVGPADTGESDKKQTK